MSVQRDRLSCRISRTRPKDSQCFSFFPPLTNRDLCPTSKQGCATFEGWNGTFFLLQKRTSNSQERHLFPSWTRCSLTWSGVTGSLRRHMLAKVSKLVAETSRTLTLTHDLFLTWTVPLRPCTDIVEFNNFKSAVVSLGCTHPFLCTRNVTLPWSGRQQSTGRTAGQHRHRTTLAT